MKRRKRLSLLVCVLAGLTLLAACNRSVTTQGGTNAPDTSVIETGGNATEGNAVDVTAQIAELTEKMQQAADEGNAEAAEAYANQILALDSANEEAEQVLRDLHAVAGSSMK